MLEDKMQKTARRTTAHPPNTGAYVKQYELFYPPFSPNSSVNEQLYLPSQGASTSLSSICRFSLIRAFIALAIAEHAYQALCLSEEYQCLKNNTMPDTDDQLLMDYISQQIIVRSNEMLSAYKTYFTHTAEALENLKEFTDLDRLEIYGEFVSHLSKMLSTVEPKPKKLLNSIDKVLMGLAKDLELPHQSDINKHYLGIVKIYEELGSYSLPKMVEAYNKLNFSFTLLWRILPNKTDLKKELIKHLESVFIDLGCVASYLEQAIINSVPKDKLPRLVETKGHLFMLICKIISLHKQYSPSGFKQFPSYSHHFNNVVINERGSMSDNGPVDVKDLSHDSLIRRYMSMMTNLNSTRLDASFYSAHQMIARGKKLLTDLDIDNLDKSFGEIDQLIEQAPKTDNFLLLFYLYRLKVSILDITFYKGGHAQSLNLTLLMNHVAKVIESINFISGDNFLSEASNAWYKKKMGSIYAVMDISEPIISVLLVCQQLQLFMALAMENTIEKLELVEEDFLNLTTALTYIRRTVNNQIKLLTFCSLEDIFSTEYLGEWYFFNEKGKVALYSAKEIYQAKKENLFTDLISKNLNPTLMLLLGESFNWNLARVKLTLVKKNLEHLLDSMDSVMDSLEVGDHAQVVNCVKKTIKFVLSCNEAMASEFFKEKYEVVFKDKPPESISDSTPAEIKGSESRDELKPVSQAALKYNLEEIMQDYHKKLATQVTEQEEIELDEQVKADEVYAKFMEELAEEFPVTSLHEETEIDYPQDDDQPECALDDEKEVIDRKEHTTISKNDYATGKEIVSSNSLALEIDDKTSGEWRIVPPRQKDIKSVLRTLSLADQEQLLISTIVPKLYIKVLKTFTKNIEETDSLENERTKIIAKITGYTQHKSALVRFVVYTLLSNLYVPLINYLLFRDNKDNIKRVMKINAIIIGYDRQIQKLNETLPMKKKVQCKKIFYFLKKSDEAAMQQMEIAIKAAEKEVAIFKADAKRIKAMNPAKWASNCYIHVPGGGIILKKPLSWKSQRTQHYQEAINDFERSRQNLTNRLSNQYKVLTPATSGKGISLQLSAPSLSSSSTSSLPASSQSLLSSPSSPSFFSSGISSQEVPPKNLSSRTPSLLTSPSSVPTQFPLPQPTSKKSLSQNFIKLFPSYNWKFSGKDGTLNCSTTISSVKEAYLRKTLEAVKHLISPPTIVSFKPAGNKKVIVTLENVTLSTLRHLEKHLKSSTEGSAPNLVSSRQFH